MWVTRGMSHSNTLLFCESSPRSDSRVLGLAGWVDVFISALPGVEGVLLFRAVSTHEERLAGLTRGRARRPQPAGSDSERRDRVRTRAKPSPLGRTGQPLCVEKRRTKGTAPPGRADGTRQPGLNPPAPTPAASPGAATTPHRGALHGSMPAQAGQEPIPGAFAQECRIVCG